MSDSTSGLRKLYMSLCSGMYQVGLSDNNFQQQIRDQNHALLIGTLILGIRLNVSGKFATWNLLKMGGCLGAIDFRHKLLGYDTVTTPWCSTRRLKKTTVQYCYNSLVPFDT